MILLESTLETASSLIYFKESAAMHMKLILCFIPATDNRVIIVQRQKGYPTISDWIRDVCCPQKVSGSCWIQGRNRTNIKGTGARGFMEKGMMVSPKLVPLNSLHSCHWKVPGSLPSLWERMQLFKSKDLAAAEMHGTRGSCLIGPTDSLRFGVSVPSKYIPACSSLAQSYCLIYNRDMV